MKLGFYYHISLRKTTSGMFLPGYLAVFVDALAREVEHLKLFLHEDSSLSNMGADTCLQEKNISWVNLGTKTAAWHRSLFYKKILAPHMGEFEQVDLLIVRSPSPLAPYFKNIISNSKICYLLVGDYHDGAMNMRINSLRDKIVQHYIIWNQTQLVKALRNSFVIVNSRFLLEKYIAITSNIFEVRTTTLREDDFFNRADTCREDVIKLAYIGRLDLQKGLVELLQAFAELIYHHNYPLELHFTGWEPLSSRPVESKLRQMAAHLKVKDKIFFHGRKKVGEELNEMYRQADIYVIPSYHEGFPRTILEAMANSCPVIATRVGSIPYYLEHEKHALLIEARSVDEIVIAVKRLIEEAELRQELIRNGYQLASGNTLEVQTKKLVLYLQNFLHSS